MTGVATSPDGIPIAYQARGADSPALVFVHGWSCDRSHWEGQMRALSRELRVGALDLAGHGRSGHGRAAWTMAAFGGDVAAVVEELELQRVVLVGHPMGGDVILEAARLLALLRADFAAATRARVRGMFPAGADAALVEHVAARMSRSPPAVAIPALESALTYEREVTVALEELRLPVIAIHGAASPTDMPSMERHGVEVVLMHDVGHFPMLEAPDTFNRVLGDVLGRLAG